MTPRFLLPALLPVLLVLGACTKPDPYAIARLGWGDPVFLDSGKVGLALWRWTEVGEPCHSGYGWSTCEHLEDIRAAFVSFSPATGKVDTLFEPRVNPQGYFPYFILRHRSPHLIYSEWESDTLWIFNHRTRQRRVLKRGGFPGEFTRSGKFLANSDSLLNIETGAVTPLALPEGLWLDYYDDLTRKAYVNRGGPDSGSYGLLYDFDTQALDSSAMRRCRYSNYCTVEVLGTALLGGPYEPTPKGRRWTVRAGLIDTVVLGVSTLASVELVVPIVKSTGYAAFSNIQDLDLKRGLVLARDEPEQGFTLVDFNDVGKRYRARDYVPFP